MKVLDRSWKNCLRMWKWISENLPVGFLKFSMPEKEDVIKFLKEQWLRENKFTNYIINACFFCEYDRYHQNDCCTCPARLVDSGFHCDDNKQSYRFNPIKFYIRLLELYIKREG